MWSDTTAPELSLPDYAKLLGISVRDAKEKIENEDRLRDGRALEAEKRAAELRYKRGGYRYNHEIDGAPQIAMSKRRHVKLHRASLMERGCRGGELLGEDCDFTEWMLKRPDMEQCRVILEKTTNKVGWTPPLVNVRLANAADHGRKERAGRIIFDTARGCWV